MLTRLAHIYPLLSADLPLKTVDGVREPASYLDWLMQLKRQSIVRVRSHTGFVMPPAMVTNETPRYVFVGKLKFRRGDGWQVKRNAGRCYRMRLRLVRNEKEFS